MNEQFNNFTMSEYIAKYGLGVSPHDPTATRTIVKHLRDRGFRPRRVKREGKFQQIWTSDPKTNMEELKNKLEKIQ